MDRRVPLRIGARIAGQVGHGIGAGHGAGTGAGTGTGSGSGSGSGSNVRVAEIGTEDLDPTVSRVLIDHPDGVVDQGRAQQGSDNHLRRR